jgi:hypothetical protein
LYQDINQIMHQVAHYEPEWVAHFHPESMVHFEPEYLFSGHTALFLKKHWKSKTSYQKQIEWGKGIFDLLLS